MQQILITGFEPFGGETINPSWEAVRLLPDTIGGYALHKLGLPVSFTSAIRELEKSVRENPPVAIVCIGQAGGRTAVTPERICAAAQSIRLDTVYFLCGKEAAQ